MTSEAAAILEQYKAGNVRYRNGAIENHSFPSEFGRTQVTPQPKAMVLTCMDSRIAPELIFDVHLGEFFDARVAGNVVNQDIIASMKLACMVSTAKVIIVMGHTDCKAIISGINEIKLGSFTGLLDEFKPCIEASKAAFGNKHCTMENEKFVTDVSRRNIIRNIGRIRSLSPLLRERESAGKLALVGCLYHVETGEAEFL
jgi:carbonic anhydrase